MQHPLFNTTAAFFEQHGLATRPGVVAVSGGPDSVALAHLCAHLAAANRLGQVTLAHLNHRLRGPESDADEDFVRSLPAAWKLPSLHGVQHWIDVAQRALAARANLENAGREARYAWLAETAQALGAAWVATGHTADDQAETVLHHFLRGSGLRGLAGIAQVRPLAAAVVLVRPLLHVRRHELLAYLEDHRLSFRHDSSNDDPAFVRNRLRHQALPQLARDFNPALVDVLGRTAQQAREIQEELARQAEELRVAAELPRAGAMVVLDRARLALAARVLVREMFHGLWQREGWPLEEMNFDDWQRLADLAAGEPRSGDFPGRIRARSVGKVLQLSRSGDLGRG